MAGQPSSSPHPAARRRAVLEARSRILAALRSFFLDRGFTEVETPVRIRAPAPEQHIDAERSGERFLRASPELHMKRLLAEGHERIFQLGPCFRRNERGAHHHPEYTMLEWYRAGADYTGILADTKSLILSVAGTVPGSTELVYQGRPIALAPLWEWITVADAFLAHAGWDPTRAFDADRFDVDLVEKVEPALPREAPVVLADYPAGAAALARRKPGHPAVAERWELYIGGLELANAYSELTDPAEQRERFETCAWQRGALGRTIYPLDEAFLAALDRGLPACAGVALGVDRLVMLLTDSPTIEDVVAFCE